MKSQIDFQSYIDAGTKAYAEGDYATGGKIFLAAMKDAKRVNLKDSSLVAILYNLAFFYSQQQRPKKAEVLLEKALSYAEAIYGRNGDAVDHIINRLADLLVKEQQYMRAEGLYNRSLQIERRLYGADDPRLAKKLLKVAWVQSLQNNFDTAEKHLKDALELQINAAQAQQASGSTAAKRVAMDIASDADELIDDLIADDVELPAS
jgi:tetratricopeptide (TPR) repeat protein